MENRPTIQWDVYSDGSGTTRGKPGGYGYVILRDGEFHKEGSGQAEETTNNLMELAGAIAGLFTLKNEISSFKDTYWHTVTLLSDSQYVLNQALGKWKVNANRDQVTLLQGLCRLLGVETQHVYGHTGNKWNERCDQLANEARKQITNTIKGESK